jgi:hypothetical protein
MLNIKYKKIATKRLFRLMSRYLTLWQHYIHTCSVCTSVSLIILYYAMTSFMNDLTVFFLIYLAEHQSVTVKQKNTNFPCGARANWTSYRFAHLYYFLRVFSTRKLFHDLFLSLFSLFHLSLYHLIFKFLSHFPCPFSLSLFLLFFFISIFYYVSLLIYFFTSNSVLFLCLSLTFIYWLYFLHLFSFSKN